MADKLRLTTDDIKAAYIVPGGDKSGVKPDQYQRAKRTIEARLEGLTLAEIDDLSQGGHIANCDVYILVAAIKRNADTPETKAASAAKSEVK